MKKTLFSLAAVAGAALAAACTVHQTETPPLSGPSTFAQSLRLTAVPDTINQDGASKSSIAVTVLNQNGVPATGIVLRVDMAVGGQLADYGTLSARTLVTGNDGTTTVTYTAPPPVPNATVNFVSIRATPIGTDAATSNGSSVDIRLVPTGVIIPPGGNPTASFTYSPTPVSVGIPVIFDGSSSLPGTNSIQITNYAWSFGDGTSGTGVTATHTYLTGATFNVTLTVTNDRGLTATSAPQSIAVGSSDPFTGDWVISPLNPVVGQTIIFNADQVQTSPGHQITQFNWTFGDGAGGTGFQAQHAYKTAGTYNVILSVVDDVGRKKVFAAKPIAVGTGAPNVVITFSPGTPARGATVNFNSNGTTIFPPAAAITSYQWNFGDGTTSALQNPTHVFAPSLAPGTYTVTLTVQDDQGRIGSGTVNVTVT
jgi:PKD repeat protein